MIAINSSILRPINDTVLDKNFLQEPCHVSARQISVNFRLRNSEKFLPYVHKRVTRAIKQAAIQHGIEAEKSKAFAEEVLNLHSAKVDFKRLEEICHEDPESTNRITHVIDCYYAKMCHHPVNFKSQPQGVNFSFPFVANTPIPEKTGSGIEVRLNSPLGK